MPVLLVIQPSAPFSLFIRLMEIGGGHVRRPVGADAPTDQERIREACGTGSTIACTVWTLAVAGCLRRIGNFLYYRSPGIANAGGETTAHHCVECERVVLVGLPGGCCGLGASAIRLNDYVA